MPHPHRTLQPRQPVIEKAPPTVNRVESSAPVDDHAPEANPTTASHILRLQQTRGNRFVARMLSTATGDTSTTVQRKKPKHQEIDPIALFFGDGNGPAIEIRSPQPGTGQPAANPSGTPAATGTTSATQTPTATKPAETPAVTPPVTPISEADATPDAIQQKLAVLQKLHGKGKLRTVVEGDVSNVSDLELNEADHATIMQGINDVRAMIAAMTPKSTGLTPAQITQKQGRYYEIIADIAPYYYQMANKDIIFGLSGKKEGKQSRYVYSHAAGRTCNVTALSIALEGQGITQADFQGSVALMGAILEAQQTESGQIKWAADQAAINKSAAERKQKDPNAADARLALSADDHALHDQERQQFVGLKLKSLRFPDFMQVGVLYFFLTSQDKIASKVQPMGLDPAALLEMKAKTPAEFDKKVGDALDLASDGILFAANFKYFAGRLFGKIEASVGHLIETGVEPLTKMMNGTPAEKAQFQSLLATYKPQIDALEQARQQEHDQKAKKKKKPTPYAPLSLDKALYAVLDAQQDAYEKSRKKDKKGKSLIKNPLAMLKNTPQGKITYDAEVKAYKEKALKTLPPLIHAGKTIEISRPGHFMYLAGLNDSNITIKDVGSYGRKHEPLTWEAAYDEGLLNTYIAYSRNDDAGKHLDAEMNKGKKNK